MATAPLTSPAPETAPMSEGSRIINTFLAPSKTFTDLQRSSSWWAPWLLIAIFSLIFIYTIDREVGFDQITKNEIAKSSRAEQFEKLPADQKAKQMQFSTTLTRVLTYGSPVLALIAFLVIAAALMGLFNLGLGASVRFGTAMAIAVYGSLPSIFGAILGVISLAAGAASGSLDRDAFNVRNPVATNPAYFMDPVSSKFLYGMVSMFDLLTIWTIVLMGIGFSCNSKVKRGTAIAVVAACYIVYKVIASGLGAAFS